MLIHVKSFSMSAAVLFFFIIAAIAWLAGLAPLTCCRRAVLAAATVYVAATILTRWVNRILIEAMLKSRMNQQNGDMTTRAH